jgi:hypothetical protein
VGGRSNPKKIFFSNRVTFYETRDKGRFLVKPFFKLTPKMNNLFKAAALAFAITAGLTSCESKKTEETTVETAPATTETTTTETTTPAADATMAPAADSAAAPAATTTETTTTAPAQ